MFTTAQNFFARHASVVMPKTTRKPSPPPLQFNYPLPYGAILHDGGVQFVVFSRSATAMRVLLYDRVTDREPVPRRRVQSAERPLGRYLERLRSRPRSRRSSITFRPTGRSTQPRASASIARRG